MSHSDEVKEMQESLRESSKERIKEYFKYTRLELERTSRDLRNCDAKIPIRGIVMNLYNLGLFSHIFTIIHFRGYIY